MLLEIEMIEIQLMFKQGLSLKKIARKTGYSINTVRKYVYHQGKPSYSSRPEKPSILDKYKKYIRTRVEQAKPNWIPATVLLSEIKARGYSGSLSLLRDYLRSLKPKIKERELIRFETEPGEQMQVDFAHFKFNDKKFYSFVAVLGFSRALYIKFVEDQTVDTVIKCHEDAFEYFGGVPKNGLYDNMKSVIVKRNAYGDGKHKLQDCFYDFAKHYGIIPIVCKPYNPQTKGKVERMISYLRYCFYNPFIAGKDDINLEDLNSAVSDWLDQVANLRVHATTKDIPFVRLTEEKKYLQRIPLNYTTNYGITNDNSSSNQISKDIMLKSQDSIQHDLDVYDALLSGGMQ